MLAFSLLSAPATAAAVNPVTFSPVGEMEFARGEAGAARLADGRILVVGGTNGSGGLDSAELFDPKTKTFSSLSATMTTARAGPGVASLPDGRVLIAGGGNAGGDIKTAEVFSPATFSFYPVGAMASARQWPAVAVFSDGRVLIAGGKQGTLDKSTEIFDPKANTFAPGPSTPVAISGAASAGISGGRTLIAGGINDSLMRVTSAFIFNPTGVFGPAQDLPNHVSYPAGASLPQGRALVAGGYENELGAESKRALIFDPATNAFSSSGIGDLTSKRSEATAAELSDGRVLVAGGFDGSVYVKTAEILGVPSNAFTAKLKGRKVTFNVSNEGTGEATDGSTNLATTAKKKKKKPRLVKTTTKHGGPGKIVVKVQLTKRGAAKLAQKGKLKVKVAYIPDQGLAATKKLKLRG